MPIELMTMAGGAISGFLFQMAANAQKDRAEQFKMLSKTHKMTEDSIKAARAFDTPSSNWVRRFIVVCSYGIAMFLIVAGLFVPTNIITDIPTFNFLGLTLGGGIEVIKLNGIVAYPWIAQSVMAIIAFYFGQKPAKR